MNKDTNYVSMDEAYASMESYMNPFPIEVFPMPIQQIIDSTKQCLNFPADFTGASILFTASLAIGNTHRVLVNKGWQENSVLFIANVGRPGTNKSHPLSFMLQPIFEQQGKNYTEYEKKKKEYDCKMKLTKEERQRQGYDEPVKPFWEKYTVSDYTPEALNEVHKYNKRGIGVYSDELAGWIKNFNRYHKGAEQEFWLSAWSNKQIVIDRKKDEPIYIPFPFIPVVGNIQPSILFELSKNSGGQNGFIDRILFAFPEGLQKLYWSDKELEPVIFKNWNLIITNLLNIPLNLNENQIPSPVVLAFNQEASNKIKDWQKHNTNLCNSAKDESLEGIYSKLEVYAVRFSLILEMLMFACGESDKQSIGIEAVNGAIKLVEYFRATAAKVNSIISNYNPLDKLPADKRKLYELLPLCFTRDTGLKIAQSIGLAHATYDRFLADNRFFKKMKIGEYEKIM